MNKKVVLIIPSYEPTDTLIKLIDELKIKFKKIIVVNDGSGNQYNEIYKKIEDLEEVTLLNHNINLGKGRALKTAFKFYLNEMIEKYEGVVTLDSDGQHRPKDVETVGLQLQDKSNYMIMGTREFNLDYVPLKSKIGNLFTVKILSFLCGVKTKDTQTGLRGFGNEVIKKVVDVSGERFEYETNILLESKKLGIEIEDVDIETVYFEGNKGTHFNPIKDSLKIYRIILKFALSGIISAVIDLFLFWFLQKLSIGLLVSNLSARGISSVFNFLLNKNIVFKSKENLKKSIFEYYILVLIMGIISSGLIKYLSTIFDYNDTTLIKIGVELFLFFISFSVQNKVIFKGRKK